MDFGPVTASIISSLNRFFLSTLVKMRPTRLVTGTHWNITKHPCCLKLPFIVSIANVGLLGLPKRSATARRSNTDPTFF